MLEYQLCGVLSSDFYGGPESPEVREFLSNCPYRGDLRPTKSSILKSKMQFNSTAHLHFQQSSLCRYTALTGVKDSFFSTRPMVLQDPVQNNDLSVNLKLLYKTLAL
jgi:hypothetical protein